MDRQQLSELAQWGKQLKEMGESGEARAAGRAILLLVAEVERLQDEGSQPPRTRTRARPAPSARTERGRTASERRERALDDAPAVEITEARRSRTLERARRRRRARLRLGIALAALAALGFGAFSAAARIARPDLQPGGPEQGAKIGAAARKQLVFWLRGSADTLARTRWTLDGKNVTDATRLAGDRLVYDATRTRDGAHALVVSAPGPFPGADARHQWRFELDTTAPRIRVPRTGVEKGKPVRVAGRVDEGATVMVDGKPLEVQDGRFTLAYRSVPSKPVYLVATDEFKNRTIRPLRIKLVPRRPPFAVRAVHVTADAWRTPSLRNGILELIAQRRINAVELDLKDEAGIVGFDADVPLGKRIGAVKRIYDLERAVELLHARGVRVIGRLVAFRDPIHAAAAWRAGDRAQVVQTPSGEPYSGYGGFTNFANPVVRQYNIDVARAAADAGVDEVLYDYVRRPDGPPSSMAFPGLRGTPEAAIASFLAETRRQLPRHVFLGASVFGVAATRPREVAQDIPRMAREVDYIAPMLYPSHWAPGEYGVAHPNGQPYDIVVRSLRDFLRQTAGTGARVVPWLQDFSLGVAYGPAEVRAQIRAARDVRIPEWILWDPLVTYTADALEPTARRARLPRPPASEPP